MNIDADLHAAGRRAAAQPVPSAPAIATLEAGAAKHTSRRRLVVSGAAMVLIAALAFPLALTMRGSTTVQTVAAGTGQAAAAPAQADPAQPAPAQQEPEQQDSEPSSADGDEDVRIQIRAGDDFAVSIRVVSGEAAVAEAAAAATNATETLDVDGLEVWVRGDGNERTVAALVEPTEFVEVSGSADQLDMLIQVLRDGGLHERGERQGIHGFGDDEWQQFFGQFEDGNFSFDIDGIDGLDLDIEDFLNDFDGFDFDGEFGEFEDFFGPNGFNFDGDFDDLFGPDGFDFDGFDFDGEFGDFDDFFGPDGFNFDGNFDDFFGPDGFNFDGNFEDFFGPDGFNFGDGFDGCIVIDHTDAGDGVPFHLEIPQGCESAG